MRNDGIQVGSVIKALAGRDTEKNGIYAVVAIEDSFICIADGRRRKVQSPKRKNPRHLWPTGAVLHESEISTNRMIRQALQKARDKRQEARFL